MALTLITVIVLIIIYLLSSIPLWLAVKVLGGEGGLLKVTLINVLSGIIPFILAITIGETAFLVLIVTILVYKFFFHLGILRAFFAWLLQYVFAFILVVIIGLIGIGVVLPKLF